MERAAGEQDHKERVRQEFTRQATRFAAAAWIGDQARVARLVQAVEPSPEARVLEVATGPGYVAQGFAAVCREVVGLDLTPALIEIAEQQRRERGLDNLRFQVGDAEHLPFGDGEFDIVVCRFAFHHLPEPARVLGEMARVCRLDGAVAVEDIIASEQPERADYQNRFERLRDPSHQRALPLTELVDLFTAAGLELRNLQLNLLILPVERWLSNSHTPPERAAQVLALLEADLERDLSGVRPFRQDGELYFRQRTIALVGRKLPAR